MLNDAETKNLLNRHFDLVILDGAFPECAVSLVYAYRVPFMLINTVGFYTGSLSLAGNPAPYSTTPIFFSSFTDDMNLYQRFLNTIYTVFAFTMHRVSICIGCFSYAKFSFSILINTPKHWDCKPARLAVKNGDFINFRYVVSYFCAHGTGLRQYEH